VAARARLLCELGRGHAGREPRAQRAGGACPAAAVPPAADALLCGGPVSEWRAAGHAWVAASRHAPAGHGRMRHPHHRLARLHSAGARHRCGGGRSRRRRGRGLPAPRPPADLRFRGDSDRGWAQGWGRERGGGASMGWGHVGGGGARAPRWCKAQAAVDAREPRLDSRRVHGGRAGGAPRKRPHESRLEG
jgi:hypothetical protein